MHYLFLDESGDHGLSNINPYFPVFALCGAMFEQDDYESCRTSINDIKQKYWGSSEVILHSSDIRKCQKEFKILLDPVVKTNFFADINNLITTSKFVIIADGIKKDEYIKKYGKLSNVYELCLSFIIERCVFYLERIPGEKSLCLIIEERGKKENRALKEHFDKILSRGTGYVDSNRLKAVKLRMEFRSKQKNINGLQLADLLAYPIARFVLDRKQPNPAFDILYPKFYRRYGKLYGLKTYP